MLIIEADNLKQTITVDLDAASVPDDETPGQVSFGCQRRSVKGAPDCWDPRHGRSREYWVCGECEAYGEKTR